jgi:hypothetical protein
MTLIKSIVYVSTATEPMTAYALEHLVRQARIRNESLGLSGALLCSERKFMQCLEGPADHLDLVLTCILADRRHKGVELLLEQTLTRRDFSGWAMGYSSIYARNEDKSVTGLIRQREDATPARSLLAAFRG